MPEVVLTILVCGHITPLKLITTTAGGAGTPAATEGHRRGRDADGSEMRQWIQPERSRHEEGTSESAQPREGACASVCSQIGSGELSDVARAPAFFLCWRAQTSREPSATAADRKAEASEEAGEAASNKRGTQANAGRENAADARCVLLRRAAASPQLFPQCCCVVRRRVIVSRPNTTVSSGAESVHSPYGAMQRWPLVSRRRQDGRA